MKVIECKKVIPLFQLLMPNIPKSLADGICRNMSEMIDLQSFEVQQDSPEVLQSNNERLEYTLLGVMHSVDKCLDGDELKKDEVNHVAAMRENILQTVESLQDVNKKLSEAYNAMFKDLRIRIKQVRELQAENKMLKQKLDDLRHNSKSMSGD